MSFTLHSCNPQAVPPELYGNWKSNKHKITVRTKNMEKEFIFNSDSVLTTLTINKDNSVEGNIGSAVIENGTIKANRFGGVAYTIKCNISGKIFDKDPLETKNVQFWLSTDYERGDWELRYTSHGSQFPMAFIYFSKEDHYN